MKKTIYIFFAVSIIAFFFAYRVHSASREGSSRSARPCVAYGVSSTGAGGGNVIKAILVDTNGVIQTG